MSKTEIIANYIAAQRYENLSPEVIARVKELVLDTIGCALGGSVTEAGQVFRNFARQLGGAAEATIAGDSARVSVRLAAGTNAYLANRLDFDETSRNGHIGAPIVLSALALAEHLGASGRAFLTAIATAYEVSSRVGSMAFIAEMAPGDIRDLVSPNYMIFGPLTVAAKLWELEAEQVRRALDLGWSSPPAFNAAFLSDPAFGLPNMLKNNYLACCQAGIDAVLLARAGFVATRDLLDRDPTAQIADLDFAERSHVLEHMQFKPWSTCRFIHGGIGLTLDIMREEGIGPDEIEEIVFRSFRWVCSPPYDNTRPRHWNDVTWSVPYGIALAALGVPPGPEWYDPARLADPRVHRLADRVRLEASPEASQAFLRRGGIVKPITEIELRARGKTFRRKSEGYPGDPDRPLSPAAVREKFRRLASYALASRRVEEIVSACERVEDLGNVASLARLLAA